LAYEFRAAAMFCVVRAMRDASDRRSNFGEAGTLVKSSADPLAHFFNSVELPCAECTWRFGRMEVADRDVDQ